MSTKLPALILIVATLLTFVLAPTTVVPASARSDETYNFVETLYLPAKVIIQFDFTQNYSKSDVQTISQSLWELTISPQRALFTTNDTDIFKFSITIAYPKARNSTILMGVYSGERVISERQITYNNGKSITVSFELRTEKMPHYPTSEEVAEALMTALRGEFSGWTDAINNSIRVMDRNTYSIAVIAGGESIIVIVVLFIAFLYWKEGRNRPHGRR